MRVHMRFANNSSFFCSSFKAPLFVYFPALGENVELIQRCGVEVICGKLFFKEKALFAGRCKPIGKLHRLCCFYLR